MEKLLRVPRFWGIHAEPGLRLNWMLAALPFLLAVAIYLVGSYHRLSLNPDDKILPPVARMISTIYTLAFEADQYSGEYLMLKDTLVSLRRIASGMLISSIFGILLGLNIGVFKGLKAFALPFLTFFSVVPPLALLPILFIAFGIDEFAKIMLIFIGTFPVIARDIYLASSKMPREQITKAFTLGASQLQVVYKIILPQIIPRAIDAILLSLGAAWLFLIASEGISSESGLGFRIFLVRKYFAMDIIIPYVIWITLIGVLTDFIGKKFIRWKYPWYAAQER